MSCFDKEHYKEIKEWAKPAGAKTITCKDGSFTVAYIPARTGLKMYQVAVSYCSEDDKFKKKHGKYHALYKLACGECVQLPLGLHMDPEGTLTNMFYL